MPSLHQLLAQHSPLLLLDAASSRIQVGWIGAAGSDARWSVSEEEAGVGLFQSLQSLGVSPHAAGAWVFCDGPGSVLGTRTVAMALRTWGVLSARPTYAYHSLALVAAYLGRNDLAVISDARREAWNHFQLGGTLRRVPVASLRGELVMPEHFRTWSQEPAGLTRVADSVAEMLPRVSEYDLFRPIEAPDAFLHEEPSYVTWTPQVHRAPSAT